MGSVPAGCQAGSLYGADRQWGAWIVCRTARDDCSQSQGAIVLAYEAEQSAILTPNWSDNTSEFAEALRLTGLDAGCIEVGDEEARGRRGGAQCPE
jgi:hypothetical protein